MRAQVHAAACQALQGRRLLQLPILPTALHTATGNTTAPVALIAEVTVQGQRQLQQRTLQIQLQRLATLIATTIGLQAPKVGIADADATQIQTDARLLAGIQRRVQLQATQTRVAKGQTLPTQRKLALRRL